MRATLLLLAITATAQAQWDLQTSNTTASLRGIHALGNGIAWASGTEGTVLHTTDNGAHWQRCTTPPDAEKLDFRGVQAFDANTAIVMSSGKGDLSRLYKTTDACKTWKLVATNPDKEGFWDSMNSYSDVNAVSSNDPERVLILGDSVDGKPKVWEWKEGWDERELEPSYQVRGTVPAGEGAFAASNSVLEVATTPQVDKTWKWNFRWASGVPDHVFISYVRDERTLTCEPCREESARIEVPMSTGSAGGGIFSFHFRTEMLGIAVGGDYEKPQSSLKTATFSSDGGLTWSLATTPPHGYRSAVTYSTPTKTWITVGPNGTDISTDDGRNWRALKPSPGEAPDADQHWNALSLPFVVGSHGRIGVLNPEVLQKHGDQ